MENDTLVDKKQARNFEGQDLRNQIIKGEDLENANFKNANLAGANLAGANLVGAVFSGANLSETNLSGANLLRSQFNRNIYSIFKRSTKFYPIVNLSKANLSKANLSEANLSETDLSEANISETDLSGANLSRANLSGVNLSGVNLSKANLSWANLSRANLSETDLTGAHFYHSNLSEANLSEVNLSGVNLSGVNLSGVNLSGVNLSGANLSESNLSGVNFSETNLTGVKLYHTNLSGKNLSKIDLTGADLSRVDLSNANLSEANLSRAILSGTNLSQANLSKTILSRAFLSRANLTGANLSEAHLSGVDLSFALMDYNGIKDHVGDVLQFQGSIILNSPSKWSSSNNDEFQKSIIRGKLFQNLSNKELLNVTSNFFHLLQAKNFPPNDPSDPSTNTNDFEWIHVYVDTPVKKRADDLFEAAKELAKEQGMDCPYEIEAYSASWVKRGFGYVKNFLRSEEGIEITQKVKYAAKLKFIDTTQSEVDLQQSQAFEKIMNGLKEVKNGVALVGSILAVKHTRLNNEVDIIYRNLTTNELIYLKKNPKYLNDSCKLIEFLKNLTVSEESQGAEQGKLE